MAQHSKDKKDTDLETITGQLLVPSENLSQPLLKGEAQEAPPPQCPPLSANHAVLTGQKSFTVRSPWAPQYALLAYTHPVA